MRWVTYLPGTTLNTTGAIVGPAGGITGGTASGLIPPSTTVGVSPGTARAMAANALGKGFFGLALQTANFAALLSFLETQGRPAGAVQPRIATVNNQKAVLKVGTDDYYVTNISTSTTASGSSTVTTPTITLQPFFSGVALDVTPQIDDDGNVPLHVRPAVTVVQDQRRSISARSASSSCRLPRHRSMRRMPSCAWDGYIVAIGGLMSQDQAGERSGVAGLGSAPGIGMFSERGGLVRKRELVVLIKPTIIQNEQSWKQDLDRYVRTY